MDDKCVDREDLNNMYSLFQNIKAKFNVAPKTPALKGLQIAESNIPIFSGIFSSVSCLHARNVTRAVDVTRLYQTRTDVLQMSSHSRSTELHVLHPPSRLKIMEDIAGRRNNKKSHLYRRSQMLCFILNNSIFHLTLKMLNELFNLILSLLFE